jgi:excinuclease ABC subunit B
MSEKQLAREIRALEKQMLDFARNLEFEKAAKTRDELGILRKRAFGIARTDHEQFTE